MSEKVFYAIELFYNDLGGFVPVLRHVFETPEIAKKVAIRNFEGEIFRIRVASAEHVKEHQSQSSKEEVESSELKKAPYFFAI